MDDSQVNKESSSFSRSQLINEKEIMELENHHLRNTIIMILKMIQDLEKRMKMQEVYQGPRRTKEQTEMNNN